MAAAAFADAVSPLSQALQRALHLLAILVQQVHQDVGRLAVRKGLREVGVLWDARDHAARDVVQRPVEPGFLAALGGQELELPPIGLQPHLRSIVWSLANCH
jgi:hypothetical protein